MRLFALAQIVLTGLLIGTAPAHAAAWDACSAALDNQQPAEALREANALLKQEKLPRETTYYANLCLGRAWSMQGELNKALPPLREAARLADNAEQRNAAQSWLGITLESMGKRDDAETAYQTQLTAARELGNVSKEANALNSLANIALSRKQYDQALSLYTRSLTLQPDEQKKAAVLNNMAALHNAKGDQGLAVDVFQQAMAIERKFGNRDNLARLLLNLGDTYRVMRRWPDATKYLD